MRRTRSPKRMILIKQDLMQWQPYWMAWSGDLSPWKLLPGYTLRSRSRDLPQAQSLVPVQSRDGKKHMKKAAK